LWIRKRLHRKSAGCGIAKDWKDAPGGDKDDQFLPEVG
jgi:hypothetical protein